MRVYAAVLLYCVLLCVYLYVRTSLYIAHLGSASLAVLDVCVGCLFVGLCSKAKRDIVQIRVYREENIRDIERMLS
jgi:hypothetical protein